jgi:hypothetical protein
MGGHVQAVAVNALEVEPQMRDGKLIRDAGIRPD